MEKISVEKGDKGFEYWATRPFLKHETQERLRAADVLVVPVEQFRGEDVRVFPIHTEVLFEHLRERLEGHYKVEVAIEDEDYKQLSLHAILIDLGTFVVVSIAVPVLVNVLSDYIKKILAGKKEGEVRCTIIIDQRTITEQKQTVVINQTVNVNQTTVINYSGSPKDFDSQMQEQVKRLKEGERPNGEA